MLGKVGEEGGTEAALTSGCSLPIIQALRTICSCPWQSEYVDAVPAVATTMTNGSQLYEQMAALSGGRPPL